MKKLENSFVVSGFVSVDAEIRQFDSASVARFPISISKPEKNGENTTYVSAFANIEAWRKNENLADFDLLKKGNHVTVKGYFKPEQWTSNNNEKRSRLNMMATEIYLTPEKEE